MIDLARVCDKLSLLACSLDENGYFTEISGTLLPILGYTEQEFLHTHFADHVAERDLQKSLYAWQALKSGATLHAFRNYFVCKEGRLRCMEWDAVYNAVDKKCYCTGKLITVDDTDEEVLDEMQLYRKMFFDNLSAMFIYDPASLQFIMVNKAACEQYGYTEEEFKQISVLDIVPPDGRQSFLEALPTYLNSRISQLPHQHQHRSGDIIDVIAYAQTINYLNVSCRMVTAVDVTAKKMNEEKLRLFETVITNVTDGVMITSGELTGERGSRILYVNPAFEKQTGYAAAELIGQFPDVMGGREDNLRSLERMRKAMEMGQPFLGEIMNHNRSGEKYWLAVNIAPVKDQEGKVINFIGVSRDITAYKRSEGEKQNLVKDLLRTNESVQRFTYITSHDLRAPLTNIMAVIKLMELNEPGEETARYLKLLKHSSTQLNETMLDLVNMLMIKDTPVEKELIDIETIWNSIVLNNKSSIKSVGADLKGSFAESWVRFSKAYMSSILQELLTNAIKFRRVDVPLHISIATIGTPAGVRLIFSDNGMGLDPALAKDRLFGLYQRFHHGVEGKGLGLFMMRSQVHGMNGTIQVNCNTNEGFTVTIDIPK